MRQAKAIYSELAVSQGSRSLSVGFGRDSKAAQKWESFIVEKMEGFRYARVGGW